MSKTYILEPTELEFNKTNTGYLIASLENTPLCQFIQVDLANLIPDGAIIDINNGDKFIAVSDDRGTIATRDGTIPESAPEEYVQFRVYGELSTLIELLMISKITTEPGTYTVSIYTGEDDQTPKYPVKNTSYELHGHSDVERIRYKLKKKAEQGDDESGGESSGGAGVFMVNVDASTESLSETWQTIFDAISSGNLVVIRDTTVGSILANGHYLYLVTAVEKVNEKFVVNAISDDGMGNVVVTTYSTDSQDGYPVVKES